MRKTLIYITILCGLLGCSEPFKGELIFVEPDDKMGILQPKYLN